MNDWDRLLSYDCDDEEFVRGFEAGRIYERTKHEDEFDAQVRTDNAEMMLRISEATNLRLKSKFVDDRWMVVYFGGY